MKNILFVLLLFLASCSTQKVCEKKCCDKETEKCYKTK